MRHTSNFWRAFSGSLSPALRRTASKSSTISSQKCMRSGESRSRRIARSFRRRTFRCSTIFLKSLIGNLTRRRCRPVKPTSNASRHMSQNSQPAGALQTCGTVRARLRQMNGLSCSIFNRCLVHALSSLLDLLHHLECCIRHRHTSLFNYCSSNNSTIILNYTTIHIVCSGPTGNFQKIVDNQQAPTAKIGSVLFFSHILFLVSVFLDFFYLNKAVTHVIMCNIL